MGGGREKGESQGAGRGKSLIPSSTDVCAQLSTLNFGIFISYWLDYGFVKHYPNSDLCWRFPLAFQLVIIVPIFILSFLVKESPRWLANHGRNEEALEVVAGLQGTSSDSAEARAAYQEIADAVAFEKSVMVKSWTAMFRNDELSTRRRLLIACSVQVSSLLFSRPRASSLS